MNAAQILAILLQYGPSAVDLAFQLVGIVNAGDKTLTLADWTALKAQYATKTAAQYLTEAQAVTPVAVATAT